MTNLNSSEILLLVLFGIAGLGAIVIVVYLFIKKELTLFVKEKSLKALNVGLLNSHYHFCQLEPQIDFTKNCRSKREFDATDLRYFLLVCISYDMLKYEKIIKSVKYNRKLYKSYCEKYDEILNTNQDAEKELYAKYFFFEKIERKICNEMKLSPTLSVQAYVEVVYTSPQGRNQYSSESEFSFDELKSCYNEAEELDKNRIAVKYERMAIPDSLRYDVMKRDGFKCVLCGCSVQDGVKLHIDHIYPVSKGGATTKENLRTLCDRCNLGKSDKFDPNGPN